MKLEREFTPELTQQILGRYYPDDARRNCDYRQRSPLHIDFTHHQAVGGFAPAFGAKSLDDAEEFNAVGSRVGTDGTTHMPVIDADGGASVQEVKGSKVIIYPAPQSPINSYQVGLQRFSFGRETISYTPGSLLRDVLGDNGIDLEVFEEPQQQWRPAAESYEIAGKKLTAIVLRARERDVFDVVDSTKERHSHVYIQREFQESDHQTLITELGSLGIITARWQQIVEHEGMGIVRTPWTEKATAKQTS